MGLYFGILSYKILIPEVPRSIKNRVGNAL